MFDTDISAISIIMLGAALLTALAALFFGLRPLRRTVSFRGVPGEIPAPGEEDSPLPMLSLLVYAKADKEEIKRFLDMISTQTYPNRETIIVFDTTPETADMLTEELAPEYPGVHFTFIPKESHHLSRPKLAITVGVKAARGEVIVTTSYNAVVASDSWLSEIARTFAGNSANEVTLGYSCLDFGQMHGPGKWYRQFDSVLTSCQWIGAAAAGHPYRGDRNNLAFLKKTFDEHRGYARTINLHNGHDDLFVHEISTGDNTTLLLTRTSMVTMDWGTSANRVWSIAKEGYAFTSQWLPKGPFVLAGFTSAAQWLVLAFCSAAVVCGLPSLIPAFAAAVILLAFWGVEISTYRRAASRLGAVRLWWGVVPFWLLRPIANTCFGIAHRRERLSNFTWRH